MSFALLFAILMVIWAVTWFTGAPGPYGIYVSNGLIWVLFALLGWHVFGPLVHP